MYLGNDCCFSFRRSTISSFLKGRFAILRLRTRALTPWNLQPCRIEVLSRLAAGRYPTRQYGPPHRRKAIGHLFLSLLIRPTRLRSGKRRKNDGGWLFSSRGGYPSQTLPILVSSEHITHESTLSKILTS
jgi:hypothetical protein